MMGLQPDLAKILLTSYLAQDCPSESIDLIAEGSLP